MTRFLITSVFLLAICSLSVACGSDGDTGETFDGSASTEAVRQVDESQRIEGGNARSEPDQQRPSGREERRSNGDSTPGREAESGGGGDGKVGPPAPGPDSTGDPAIDEFGEEATGGDRRAVIAAARSYLRARARGDWSKACDQLSDMARQQMEDALRSAGAPDMGCARAYAGLQGTIPRPLRAEAARSPVLEVRVEGDSAFYVYRTPANKVDTVIAMNREGGEWKVVTLGGAVVPRPPGS